MKTAALARVPIRGLRSLQAGEARPRTPLIRKPASGSPMIKLMRTVDESIKRLIRFVTCWYHSSSGPYGSSGSHGEYRANLSDVRFRHSVGLQCLRPRRGDPFLPGNENGSA